MRYRLPKPKTFGDAVCGLLIALRPVKFYRNDTVLAAPMGYGLQLPGIYVWNDHVEKWEPMRLVPLSVQVFFGFAFRFKDLVRDRIFDPQYFRCVDHQRDIWVRR